MDGSTVLDPVTLLDDNLWTLVLSYLCGDKAFVLSSADHQEYMSMADAYYIGNQLSSVSEAWRESISRLLPGAMGPLKVVLDCDQDFSCSSSSQKYISWMRANSIPIGSLAVKVRDPASASEKAIPLAIELLSAFDTSKLTEVENENISCLGSYDIPLRHFHDKIAEECPSLRTFHLKVEGGTFKYAENRSTSLFSMKTIHTLSLDLDDFSPVFVQDLPNIQNLSIHTRKGSILENRHIESTTLRSLKFQSDGPGFDLGKIYWDCPRLESFTGGILDIKPRLSLEQFEAAKEKGYLEFFPNGFELDGSLVTVPRSCLFHLNGFEHVRDYSQYLRFYNDDWNQVRNFYRALTQERIQHDVRVGLLQFENGVWRLVENG